MFARLLDRIAEEGRKKQGKKTKGGKPVIVKEFFEVSRRAWEGEGQLVIERAELIAGQSLSRSRSTAKKSDWICSQC